ncbi:LemA family protein [Luteimonas sp. BDR2-5]|uniref:LemA family protein n=1 Tax=Proluteimonas luteida TaxID=2878685 RepID=UPI001E5CFC65|nr:LemA family protein [Luteimonas sp. BDR2-5]MCD9028283.1 LemA family protein [Luteimonas sp. BDR2-5]
MSTSLVVLLLVAAALAAWAIRTFNRLVRLRNQVRTAWADIDVQLVRRHDLVPQLVAAVRGYAQHEQATLSLVTELRTQALRTQDPTALGEVETALGQAVGRLLALREAYPDLHASDSFLRLQQDLVDVERQLQYARRFYNGAVRDLNDAVQRFPDLLVARIAGIHAAGFFQAGDGTRDAVAVGPLA